jgi:flagellar motor switch protein FliG
MTTPPPTRPPHPAPPNAADGLRRSAIVLLSLGEQRAAEVMRLLPPDAALRVRDEMARIGSIRQVPLDARQRALGDFCDAVENHEATLSHVLDRSVERSSYRDAPTPKSNPPAAQNAARPAGDAGDAGDPTPFAVLSEADTDGLFDTIADEHPQTIALVLSHLPAEKAAELLNRLDHHRKVEVVKRIAGIENTRAEVIEEVERSLRQRLRGVMGQTIRSAGISAVAEILNSTAREVEAEILLDLEAEAPDLAEQVRRVQAILDDLLGASDDDVREVIEQLDEQTLSKALRTAGERLKQKVLWNLPPEQADAIERQLNDLSPVPVREIEAAQQRVAEVVHRLEAAGEIDLSAPAVAATPVGRQPGPRGRAEKV